MPIIMAIKQNSRVTIEAMKYKELDLNSWERKEIFDFFSTAENPYYMVTFRQDVTEIYNWAKENKKSFYCAMIWAVTEAVNSVEAFRVSVVNGKPVLLEERHPSFADLKEGKETFHIVTMDRDKDIGRFCDQTKKKSQTQNFFIDPSLEGQDLIYISSLPWIDLTALTNEVDSYGEALRNKAIPHISWGRYVEENGRKVLGLSLEVNHRFIDGYHIGKFAENLTRIIQNL